MNYDKDYYVIEDIDFFCDKCMEFCVKNFVFSFSLHNIIENKYHAKIAKDIMIEANYMGDSAHLREARGLINLDEFKYLLVGKLKKIEGKFYIKHTDIKKTISEAGVHMYVKVMNKMVDENKYKLCWDKKTNDFIYKKI